MRTIYLFLLSIGMSTLAYSNTTLTQIDGEQIAFNSLQGKWVMINYWASWCGPCLEEISELNTFYRHNHQKVALYAVNYDGLPVEKQEQLIQKYKITYPSLREDPAKSLALGALVGVPATYVFNPQGEWVNTLYGGQTMTSLSDAINNDLP